MLDNELCMLYDVCGMLCDSIWSSDAVLHAWWFAWIHVEDRYDTAGFHKEKIVCMHITGGIKCSKLYACVSLPWS